MGVGKAKVFLQKKKNNFLESESELLMPQDLDFGNKIGVIPQK